jgi:hypothetical protein
MLSPARSACFGLLACAALAGCSQDQCYTLCASVGSRLDDCLDQWPVGWEEEGARSAKAFRVNCQNQWSDLRADLAPRELSDALDQCTEAVDELERMDSQDRTCDELRALYLQP